MIAFSRFSIPALACTMVVSLGLVVNPLPACAQNAPAYTADIKSLLKKLDSQTVNEQIHAVVELGAMGPSAQPAVKPLVKLLITDDPALRYECIVALGQIGPMAKDAIESLTEFLASDNAMVQSAALESLRRIGSPSSETVIQIRRLCEVENVTLAVSAVRSLVIIAGADDLLVQKSIPLLVKALGDPRPHVRGEASIALAEIGPKAEIAVAAALFSDDPQTQLTACETLGRLDSASATTVSALMASLKSNDELVVRAAATSLANIHGNPATVLPALIKLLMHHSENVSIAAIRAIADYGPEAENSSTVILKLASDPRVALRAAAIEALGRMNDTRPEIIAALMNALSDGDARVTLNAADALSHIGEAAVPALVQKLANQNYRRLVVEVLGEIGPEAESAVPALIELLNHDGIDIELKREIFIALAAMGPKATAATASMMKILQDPSAGDARAGAAYVLAKLGERKALPVLGTLIKENNDQTVMRSIAWALVTLDPQNTKNVELAMPHLLMATSSDDPLVRKEVMTAIGKLGPASIAALPAILEHATSDSDDLVRMEALHCLVSIQAPAAKTLPVAITALESNNPRVRNAARYLLGTIGEDAHVAESVLRESLHGGDELERLLSAWALVHVAPSNENVEAAIPLLLTALRDLNPDVRLEAAVTLGKIGAGSKDVRAALEEAQSDTVPAVQEAVIKALKTVQ